MCDGNRLGQPGFYSMAGFDGLMPLKVPNTFEEIHPSMYDSDERLRFMDAQGISAQVLYPNVGGFGNAYFMTMGEPGVVKECVRAFNDWVSDWRIRLRCFADRYMCRHITKTISSTCAARSAPTTCCSAQTGLTPRASPSRRISSTI